MPPDSAQLTGRLEAVYPYTSDIYLGSVRSRLENLRASVVRLKTKCPDLTRLVDGDVEALSAMLNSDLSPAEKGAAVFAHVEPRRVLANSLLNAQAAAKGIDADKVAKAFMSPNIRRAFGVVTSVAILALVVGVSNYLRPSPSQQNGQA